jgi:hypothetical protein
MGRCATVSQTFMVVSFDEDASRQSFRPTTLNLEIYHNLRYKCNGSHASAVIHFE